MQNVVTIGGGSGHAQVLKALKGLPTITITAICGSTDSGGSSGILKHDYGSLGYLGDLTRCISALCPDEDFSEALLYRFEEGCLHKHSLKNIFLLALERVHDPERALELMHRICGIQPHHVLPVTREPTKLRADLMSGNIIIGEANIDTLSRNPLFNPAHHGVKTVLLEPMVHASEGATQAIVCADWCIICPGDLYSSVIPVLLPEGMTDAFKQSSAKIMIMLNIVIKNGETNYYRAEDFIDRIEARLGKPCDAILYNTTEVKDIPDVSLLDYYLENKVQLTPGQLDTDRRLIKAPLAMSVDRKLFHDPKAIAEALSPLFA
jgi:uncharacterized cofD-like protein